MGGGLGGRETGLHGGVRKGVGGRGNDSGQGEGSGPSRHSVAHLRVGHNQALVAFAVVAPFILVHLARVHPPVRPSRLVRPRAGGRQSAWAPSAPSSPGELVSHRLRRTGQLSTRRLSPPEATPPAAAIAEPGNFRA